MGKADSTGQRWQARSRRWKQLTRRARRCRSVLPTENAGASEVYVDKIETVSCTLGAQGDVVAAACQGVLQMKSFLAHAGLSAMLKMRAFHCAELAAQYPCMSAGAAAHAEARLQPARAPPLSRNHVACGRALLLC
jgi:hypothetical protein